MTTKTVNLYQFDELTNAAKEKAREWWRECEAQDFGAHGDLTEAYETAGKLLGIEFKQHAVPLHSGKTRYEPNIWWSLHVQGSGACFAGEYSYAKGSTKAIRSEFPTDVELNRIAKELASLQKKYNYGLTATISTSGREVHKYSMSIDVTSTTTKRSFDEASKDCDALLELMRDFADWIYKGINEEYDYRMTDENVDDTIRANDYTFMENGKRED